MGIWGVGPQNHPGNSRLGTRSRPTYGVWITNTVGFAGPDQQYTPAIMYNLQNYGETAPPVSGTAAIRSPGIRSTAEAPAQGHAGRSAPGPSWEDVPVFVEL